MQWKRIKGYPNYRLNENGDLYNTKTDTFAKGYINTSGVKYVSLSNNGASKLTQLATLVLSVFKPSKTTINTQAYHTDLVLVNCADSNLERCTRGDRQRMFNEMKARSRGVYNYPHGKKNFRVVMKDRQGKTKSLGYYKTELFARFKYVQAYKKEFGRLPF